MTGVMMKAQLFLCSRTVMRTFETFLNTGDVKPSRFGRPTGSVILCPHEEYIIIDSLLRMPQIRQHEMANYILDAAGSYFGPKTQCFAVYIG